MILLAIIAFCLFMLGGYHLLGLLCALAVVGAIAQARWERHHPRVG